MIFGDDGVEIFRSVLPPAELDALKDRLSRDVAGRRHLLRDLPAIRTLARSKILLSLVN